MANNRLNRINAEIQKALSHLIAYELQDPRLENSIVSVIKVDTTQDLSFSKVYISIFPSDRTEQVFNAIKNSIPFLRREVAKRVKLRVMPSLIFNIDDSLDYSNKIEKIIEKLNEEDR